MELKLKKNYKQWLFLIPLLAFIIVYFLIVSGAVKGIDQAVYQFLHQLIDLKFVDGVILITHLGSLIGIVGAICIVFIFNKRIALVCLVASFLQQVINRIIKLIVQRPRPDLVHLVHETSYSFPSGHAMAITCLYALFIYYLFHSKLPYRKLMISICVIVIILVCLSRVYLGVHYFSDVFAGAMLSISLVMLISNMTSFNA